MGFLSGFAQKVSSTVKSGQGGGGGGQVPWFMGGNKLEELLRQSRELEAAQLAQAAAPAGPASDIQESIRRNLALKNLNPFEYMPEGGYGAGGGGITDLPEYAAATAQQQNLAQQQALQIAAQNQAAAIPFAPGQQPVNVGSPAMNQYLAQYMPGAPQIIAHAGGFVHQHPLPGERILR